MNSSYTLQIIAPLLYVAGTVALGYAIQTGRDTPRRAGVAIAVLGALVHAASFAIEFVQLGGLSADFFSALSLVSLLILLVILIGMLRYRLLEILPLALPGAAFMMMHKLILQPEPVILETGSAMLDLHIAFAVSYSLLSIAAVTAMFIAVLHNLLHNARARR